MRAYLLGLSLCSVFIFAGCVGSSEQAFEPFAPPPTTRDGLDLGVGPSVDQGEDLDVTLSSAQVALSGSSEASAVIGAAAIFNVTLKHQGGAPLQIQSVSLDAAQPNQWRVELPPVERRVVALSSYKVRVVRQSLDLEPAQATLVWKLADETGRVWEERWALAAAVTLERELNYPERVELGRLPAGKTVRHIVPIYNSTARDERLRDVYISRKQDQIKLSLPDPEDLYNAHADAAYTTGQEVALPAGEITYLALQITTDVDAPLQDALMFVSSLGTRSIGLVGNVGVPCLQVKPARLLVGQGWDYVWELGFVEQGQSLSTSVMLANCSQTHPVKISRASLVDDAAGQLAMGSSIEDAPETLWPGEIYVLPLNVAPTQAALLEGMLRVQSDDPGRAVAKVRIQADARYSCPEPISLGVQVGGQTLAGLPVVQVKVGQDVALSGGVALGQGVLEWSFELTPVNSTARFTPNAFSAHPSFVPDLPGVYELALALRADDGGPRCPLASLRVMATAP